MYKVELEINKNGVVSKIVADYETYEELDAERNTLVNAVNFAYNDLCKKNGINNAPMEKKAVKTQIKTQYDGPATEAQLNYLSKLGYELDQSEYLTYSQANNLIRNLKNQ